MLLAFFAYYSVIGILTSVFFIFLAEKYNTKDENGINGIIKDYTEKACEKTGKELNQNFLTVVFVVILVYGWPFYIKSFFPKKQ